LLSIIIFYFKWVTHVGKGMQRKTTKALKDDEQLFFQRARDLARNNEATSQTTMKAF